MTSSSGQIVIGGEHDEQKCYIAPTVIDNVKPSDPIMQEEIFGPLLPLISCNDFGKAVLMEKNLNLLFKTVQSTSSMNVRSPSRHTASLGRKRKWLKRTP